jgi:ketosteroid isomerase-like protein
MSDKKKIIRAVFAAYIANDRKTVENTLTDDFRFTSPYDDEIDKATYFERCWRVADWIERHELEKIFVDGDQAFVTYQCTAKGGKSFRNTEFFSFEGDRIKRVDVYFGATYQNSGFVKAERKLSQSPAVPCARARGGQTVFRDVPEIAKSRPQLPPK